MNWNLGLFKMEYLNNMNIRCLQEFTLSHYSTYDLMSNLQQSALRSVFFCVLCFFFFFCFLSYQAFKSRNTAMCRVTLKSHAFTAWITHARKGAGKCTYHFQFNFLGKLELIKMIDWGLNVEGFLTPLTLIALISVSVQMLNLESPHFWQSAARRQMTGLRQ